MTGLPPTRRACASASGVAACLLGDPELMILDEPAHGLDPAGVACSSASCCGALPTRAGPWSWPPASWMRPGAAVPPPRFSPRGGSSPRARSARSPARPGLRAAGPGRAATDGRVTTGALTGDAWLPGVRLIRAEFLKLTRRRGLMIMAAALTAAAVLASDLARTGVLPGACYALMAILLGTSAGTADVTAGVFSGLVATGRSPVALFLARIPAGLALSVAFTLAGYVAAVAGAALLAGHLPAAPGGPIVRACGAFVLGLGLSSLGASIWRKISRDA